MLFLEKLAARSTSRSPPYRSVSDQQDTQSEDALLGGDAPNREYCPSVLKPNSPIWIFLTLIFASLFAWRLFREESWSHETGFRTDYADARIAIKLEEVRFTSGVWIDDNGEFHLTKHAGIPVYVGPPSPEIDHEWDEIIKPEWFHATRDEIIQQAGDEAATRLAHGSNGMYPAEIDVFHSLHCLNQLRKAIDRDYYYPSYGSRNDTRDYMHWDHCIDQLRQVLQCHGDTTMNGAIWYSGGQKTFVDTENVHTCRNFKQLREWGNKKAADTASS